MKPACCAARFAVRPLTASLFITLFIPPAAAQDQRFMNSLRKLEPNTRLEQVCDLEAMKRIKKEKGVFADRAKSDVISSPKHKDHTLTANGGAYRTGGKWFELSFVCTGTPDHLRVTAFKYTTGKAIPQSKWPELGLWR